MGMSERTEELDRLNDREAAASVAAEFPGWTPFRASDRLCYARFGDGERLVRGEDWIGLRDEIIKDTRVHADEAEAQRHTEAGELQDGPRRCGEHQPGTWTPT